MKAVVSDPDTYWRHLAIEACFSKGLHAWLAGRNWLLHAAKGGVASLACLPPGQLADEVNSFLKLRTTKM
jgi:hypothetical protein